MKKKFVGRMQPVKPVTPRRGIAFSLSINLQALLARGRALKAIEDARLPAAPDDAEANVPQVGTAKRLRS
jgi:hypothetical protein